MKKNTLWRFLGYVKPYRWMLAFATSCGILKILIPLVWPILVKQIIDDCLRNPAMSAADKWHFVLVRVIVALLLMAVFPVPTFLRRYFIGKVANRVVLDFRYDLFLHVQRMSHAFFERTRSGSIVSRLMGDIFLAQNFLNGAMTQVWISSASLVFVFAYMVYLNWKLALVSVALMPLFIINLRLLGRKVKRRSLEIQDQIAELSGELQEKISGMATIKSFTRERAEARHFFEESHGLYDLAMSNIKLASVNEALTNLIVGVAPILVMGYGAYLVIQNEMAIGALFAFYIFLGNLYGPIQSLSEMSLVFSTSLAAMDRVFEMFDVMPEVVASPSAPALPKLKGDVVFDRVCFGYQDGRPILKDVSLTAHPGEVVAIVGPSGGGKSTLVSLLPRFYDVSSGRLLLDGADVRSVTLKSLRDQVGMVLQESIIFSGTIEENILFGRPKTTRAEVVAAAKAANADEFIEAFPDTYEAVIGERGVRLSVGQRQRVAIARVFLKNPAILILDEATSALDSESENLVQDAFRKLMQNRTTFVIAHRLSTVMDADTIVVLDDGRIVETGPHDELLKKQGVYARLYEEQFKLVRDWALSSGE